MTTKSRSNDELYKLMNGNVKIIQYKELQNYNSLSELFKECKNILLLYTTKKNYGHWVCLFKNKDYIEFFDSYAMKPDEQREYIPQAFKKKDDEQIPYLTWLLYKYSKKYDINYNHHKFQSDNEKISTCGLHCCLRMINKDININDYYKLMKKASKNTNLNYDELVVKILNPK